MTGHLACELRTTGKQLHTLHDALQQTDLEKATAFILAKVAACGVTRAR